MPAEGQGKLTLSSPSSRRIDAGEAYPRASFAPMGDRSWFAACDLFAPVFWTPLDAAVAVDKLALAATAVAAFAEGARRATAAEAEAMSRLPPLPALLLPTEDAKASIAADTTQAVLALLVGDGRSVCSEKATLISSR